MIKALPFIAVGFLSFATPSIARNDDWATFGGYDCLASCLGHARGYRWAEARRIKLCPDTPSQSFNEGCEVFIDDPYRGADEDDDGDPID